MGKVLIDLQKRQPNTITVVLDEADAALDEDLKSLIGLEITVRKDVSFKTQMAWSQAGDLKEAADRKEAVGMVEGLVEAMSVMVVGSNLTNGSEPLAITVETIKSLPLDVFQGVSRLINKAQSQERLDPKPGQS